MVVDNCPATRLCEDVVLGKATGQRAPAGVFVLSTMPRSSGDCAIAGPFTRLGIAYVVCII